MNKKTSLVIASLLTAAFAFAQDAAPAAKPAATPAPAAAASTAKKSDSKGATSLVQAVPALEKLSANLSVGFESEFIFRGLKCAGQSFQPDFNLGYDIGEGFAVYAGVWNNSPLKNGDENEIDIYAGILYNLKQLTFDVGYTYYWYLENNALSNMNRSNEVHLAVSLDTTEWLGAFNVSPKLAYYHDFNYESDTIEAAFEHSFPLSSLWGEDYLAWNNGLYFGYVFYNRANGDQGGVKEANDYYYVGVTSDIVLSLTDYCKLSVGIRYAHNNYDHPSSQHHSNHLWGGTRISFGF